MEVIEIKKVEKFTRHQVRGLQRFGACLTYYKITKKDNSIIVFGSHSCGLADVSYQNFQNWIGDEGYTNEKRKIILDGILDDNDINYQKIEDIKKEFGDKNNPFSAIIKEKDLTFEEFLTDSYSNNPNNPYKRHIFIDQS